MKKLIRAATVPQSLDTFCEGILKELSKSYEVVALSSPGPAIETIRNREGVRTVEVLMERHISPFKDLKSLIGIIRVFRKEKPDIVHSMTPKAGLLCMMAAWWTKVPIRIHTFTGLVWPTSIGFKKALLKFTDRVTCACATHIIPEGEGVKNDLISGHITKKPLKVLGFGNVRGVDLDYYDRTDEVMAEAEKIADPSKFTFIFVGRIVKDKGIIELADAFIRLHDEHPDVRLILVGPYEEDLDPVPESTMKIINDNDDILSVGRQTDVRPWYAASDCFVFPSYREGFPNTVIEAGAMGLPSIVTDINGSREIIEDGINGLIIPSHDAGLLYKTMTRIYRDVDLRNRMASNSRDRIRERFEKAFVQQCQIDYYNELIKTEG